MTPVGYSDIWNQADAFKRLLFFINNNLVKMAHKTTCKC